MKSLNLNKFLITILVLIVIVLGVTFWFKVYPPIADISPEAVEKKCTEETIQMTDDELIGQIDNLKYLVLAISPLNFGIVTEVLPFQRQGSDALNMLGFNFKLQDYMNLFPQEVGVHHFFDILLNFHSNGHKFFQIKGFLNNIKDRAFRHNSKLKTFQISSSYIDEFHKRLEKEKKKHICP